MAVWAARHAVLGHPSGVLKPPRGGIVIVAAIAIPIEVDVSMGVRSAALPLTLILVLAPLIAGAGRQSTRPHCLLLVLLRGRLTRDRGRGGDTGVLLKRGSSPARLSSAHRRRADGRPVAIVLQYGVRILHASASGNTAASRTSA